MLVASLRGLPRPAWILFAGTFVNRFGSFVFPFLVLYLTRDGFTPAQAGVAASAYGLGSIGAAGLGGWCADRFGRRATIALSMFGSAAAMLTLSQARDLALITPLTGCAGLASELYRPAAGALLADVLPAGGRTMGYAVYRLAINIGVAAGVAVGGFLADRSFAWLFVGDALTSSIFGALALGALPAYGPARAATPARRRGRVGAAELARAVRGDRAFQRFLLAATLGGLSYFQAYSTLGLQVRADGLPTSVYGGLLALNGLLVMLAEVPITASIQRLPPRLVMVAGLLLSGVGIALSGVPGSFLGLAATVLIWSLGEILYSPTAAAYVSDIAPAHMRGRYLGVWGLLSGVSLTLAPLLGTRLFAWSAPILWLLCAALGLAAALLLALPRAAYDGARRACRACRA